MAVIVKPVAVSIAKRIYAEDPRSEANGNGGGPDMSNVDGAAQSSGVATAVAIGSVLADALAEYSGIASCVAVGSEWVGDVASMSGVATIAAVSAAIKDGAAESSGISYIRALGIRDLYDKGGVGAGAGMQMDAAILRKKVKIKKIPTKTHIIRVGQWPANYEQSEEDLQTMVEYHKIKSSTDRYQNALSLKKEKKKEMDAELRRKTKGPFWE